MVLDLRRVSILALAALFVLAGSSCIGGVAKNALGPGGLPKGTVAGSEAPVKTQSEWAIYPGSTPHATGVYETTDPIATVRDYYVNLLKIQPQSLDPDKQSFTFDTDKYRLVLVPTPSGGTEIDFGSLPSAQPQSAG